MILATEEKDNPKIPILKQILKPVLIAILCLIASYVVFYLIFTYFSIDPGFWNLAILFVEVGVGVIIALIVEKRTDENKTTVNRALNYIYGMVREDYVLRRDRKNLISRNLKKNLIFLIFFTLKNLELVKLWKNEKDKKMKERRAKAILYGFSDIHHSITLLNETKKVGFDVFEYRAIENIDYILNSIESKPVIDSQNNECELIRNESFFDLIRDLVLFTHRILESDPDSFESNYILQKQFKTQPDGSRLPVLAVLEKNPGKRKAHDISTVMSELMSPTIFHKLNLQYESLRNLEGIP